MKEIKLTQGKVARVDDGDYEWLSKDKWYAAKRSRGGGYVAVRREPGGREKRRPTIFMHRVIMDAPKGMDVDHANHDTLDNRRANLRLATASQNGSNRKKQAGRATSKYKGVTWNRWNKRWVAQIRLNGKGRHIGCFRSETGAARAYDAEAIRLFGEFAYPNFKEAV